MDSYSIRSDCRLCGSIDLQCVLSLLQTPLANEFPPGPLIDVGQDEFPLLLSSCRDCGHVQLPIVVDPARLFRDYVYVSGTSPVFVDHFRRYAEAMRGHVALREGDLVVEVGSNDGTLLRFFRDMTGRVLGIDPAREIAARATAAGLETWPEFFDEAVADRILRERGPAKLIVANNVFAHADDLAGIARGAKSLLHPDGRFVFEVSYLPDVLRGKLFDTIYHEHLSYHSLWPLLRFFRTHGMSVVDAERVNTHGGSIRVMVSADPDALPKETRLKPLLDEERGLGLGPKQDQRPVFTKLAADIAERASEVARLLRETHDADGTVAGYGAPAKATTLLRAFGADELIDFVVDNSPFKQGRWMPGGRIPVLPSSAIAERKPDLVLVLAWNFADSIIERLASYRAGGGRVAVPLPDFRVL